MTQGIDTLTTDPRPPCVEKLAGRGNAYRISGGDYRALNEISDRTLLVLVVPVAHRCEAYRRDV